MEDITGEKWKDIEGHEGTRQVSNKGRLRHWDKKTNEWKLNQQKIKKNGYCYVNPTKDGEELVHRIVAKAFIDNPGNKETVNHKNQVKACNCVENLEWMTQLQNNKEYEEQQKNLEFVEVAKS